MIKKIKIAIIVDDFQKGGGEQSLINLYNQLDKNKYEIDMYVCNHIYKKNCISLLSKIPDWVKVIDLNKDIEPQSWWQKKIYNYTLDLNLLRNGGGYAGIICRERYGHINYDLAITIGEWVSPSFMINIIKSHSRIHWIHTDLSQIKKFNQGEFFKYDHEINRYIFVSKSAMLNSINKFKFIAQKSVLVKNIIDQEANINQGLEKIDKNMLISSGINLLTVANIRPEKGYLRSVELAGRIKKLGFEFNWIALGAFAESDYLETIKHRIIELGISENFHLLGAEPNPYKYMSKADLLVLLSDYEAWPLAVAESFSLGLPVFATKTAGSSELINHQINGILCDFNDNDIFEKMKKIFTEKNLLKTLKIGAVARSKKMKQQDGLIEFEEVVDDMLNEAKKIEDNSQKISNKLKPNQILLVGKKTKLLHQKDFLEAGKNKNKHFYFFNNDFVSYDKVSSYFDRIDIDDYQTLVFFHLRLFQVLYANNYTMFEKINKIFLILVKNIFGTEIAFKIFSYRKFEQELKKLNIELIDCC